MVAEISGAISTIAANQSFFSKLQFWKTSTKHLTYEQALQVTSPLSQAITAKIAETYNPQGMKVIGASFCRFAWAAFLYFHPEGTTWKSARETVKSNLQYWQQYPTDLAGALQEYLNYIAMNYDAARPEEFINTARAELTWIFEKVETDAGVSGLTSVSRSITAAGSAAQQQPAAQTGGSAAGFFSAFGLTEGQGVAAAGFIVLAVMFLIATKSK